MKFFLFVVVMFMSMASFAGASDVVVESTPGTQAPSESIRKGFQVVKRPGGYQGGLPSGVMKMIFTYATMAGCDPRMLEASVCKFWHNCFRNEQGVPEKDFTYNAPHKLDH